MMPITTARAEMGSTRHVVVKSPSASTGGTARLGRFTPLLFTWFLTRLSGFSHSLPSVLCASFRHVQVLQEGLQRLGHCRPNGPQFLARGGGQLAQHCVSFSGNCQFDLPPVRS